MQIHPVRKVQIALFKANKALITILAKHLVFVNVFSKKYIAILLEYVKINTYIIDLKGNKQPSSKPSIF